MRTEGQAIESPRQIVPLSLAETNLIQAQMWEEAGGDWDDWIQKNSQHFRLIIDRNPGLAELYRQEPEKFKQVIKYLLNESPTVH